MDTLELPATRKDLKRAKRYILLAAIITWISVSILALTMIMIAIM